MGRKQFFYVPALALIMLSLISCNPEKDTTGSANVSGYVQKGPFVSGSSITAFALKKDLSQAGLSYNAIIKDNNGSFDLGSIGLLSDYVCLRADGFYFNEITGKQSASQITLYALSDVSDKGNINVNILTHLEKPRIEYLESHGKSFTEAKKQAQSEVLAIFGIEKNSARVSEEMNILEGGQDNAILLAVSAIVQGYRSESELTELLSGIGNDIEADGTLDNAALKAALFNHAFYIDTTKVITNLHAICSETGVTPDIPYFGKFITGFLAGKSPDENATLAAYPENGSYGKNVLDLNAKNFLSGLENPYSLAAGIPANVSLKVIITSLSSDTVFYPATDSTDAYNQITRRSWYYFNGTGINWAVTTWDEINGEQSFTATGSNLNCDIKLFFDPGRFRIDYYEMNATIPTRRKIITVN